MTTETAILFLIVFGVGIACGCFLMALLAAKSDADDYYDGFHDGYQDGKSDGKREGADEAEKQFIENMQDICSHCAYKGI